jgi:hypothetical protein
MDLKKLNNVFKKLFLICLIFLLISCKKNNIKTLTFSPGPESAKDAYVTEGFPKYNYSHLPFLHMLSYTKLDTIDNDSQFLLRFGFASLPQTLNVDSAFIKLFAYDKGHFGTNNSFYIEPITEVWINKEVNWQNKPKTNSKEAILLSAPSHKMQDYKINVTKYVTQVLENKRSNNGHLFRLVDEEKPHKGLRFCSGEHDSADKRPRLEIYYHE